MKIEKTFAGHLHINSFQRFSYMNIINKILAFCGRFPVFYKKAGIGCALEKLFRVKLQSVFVNKVAPHFFAYRGNIPVIAVLPLALALYHGILTSNVPLLFKKPAVIKTAEEQCSVISIGDPLRDKYDKIIIAAAERYDIDPFLIKAVIQVESQFYHGAVSRYGAKGLMQLMPVTAEILDVEDIFDASDNIIGGARHIRGLLNRYKTIESALGFYYAGTRYTRDPEIGSAYISAVMRVYEEFKYTHTLLCSSETVTDSI